MAKNTIKKEVVKKRTVKEYYKLQTCGDRRVEKIKNILKKSGEIIGKDITKLKETDITKFLKKINDSNYTEWTKNDYKKIFKNFVKWCYRNDFPEWLENKNISEGFKCRSKKRAFNKKRINKETLIKPKELEKLLRNANSLKWKALLTCLFESAFRPCELVSLKWGDLTFQDSQGLCSIKTISPKTKEMRSVPVKDCVLHLKRWREEFEFPERTEKDFVFPNPQDREKHLSPVGVGVLIKRLCVKAKVRHIFPYMFRHSRIYEIQKKLGSRIASKFAGHSLETSEIYDHLDSDDVEEAMLEKVYVTKELTPEEKEELEEMKKRISAYMVFNMQKQELMERMLVGDVSKKDFIKELNQLEEIKENTELLNEGVIEEHGFS